MKKLCLLIIALFATITMYASGDEAIKALRGKETTHTGSSSFVFGKETHPVPGRKTSQLEVVNATPASKQQVKMNAGDGTTIYGELCYSSLWENEEEVADGLLDWGVYSFPAQANTSLKEEYLHRTIQANGGGAYHDGKLYFTSYYEGPFQLLYLYFCTLNVETWEMEEQIALPTDIYSSIALDMTYDPVSRQLYTQSYDDETGNTYTLSIMNIETGYVTPVVALERMSFIVCDITGQMYGVRYSDGMFCKIDKNNGTVTPVGSTGVLPKYMGSGAFDFQTGKLYWVTTSKSANEESGLYEIDITTGQASLISIFPNNEQITCLYIPGGEEEYGLGDIQQFTATFEQETTGVITVQAPATDSKGNAITGNITVVVYDNGKLLFSRSANPGEIITQNATLSNGSHKLEAMATHAVAGKSRSKELTIYIGTDGPAPVTNLTLTREGNKAKLTWDTPTEGMHGGVIKPNLVYYNIIRHPDNVLVGEDIDGNSWEQTITSDLYRDYFYEVVGYYKAVEGGSAFSNKVAFGTPYEVPYNIGFDTFEEFMTCLIYNENDDDGFWGYVPSSQSAAYRYDTFNDADDYIFIPAVKLEAGETYKLKYKASSYGGFLYPESMEVLLGKGQGVDDLTVTLVENQQYPHDDLREYEAVIENITETGAYFIAFHATTGRGEFYLYLDDVQVLNGPSATAPGLVENLVITPAPKAALATNISFNAPTKDFSGRTLEEITAINIYRENVLIKTFGATTPGTAISYDDTEAQYGINHYKIVVSNSNGDGNPAEMSCWAGIDVPMAPTEPTHTTINGVDAIITWVAPAQGVNGGSIDYDKLTYTITRNDDVVVATGIKETTYTDTTIDTSNGQKNVFYNITAVNEAGGTSEVAKTHFLVYGNPYTGEYHESFKNGKTETTPWVIEIVAESINPSIIPWTVNTRGENPVIDAQDGDNGLVTFTRNTPWASSRIISPRLNSSDIKNPVLTFWMYHYYNPLDIWSTDQDIMQPELLIDGEYIKITEKPILLINGKGWYKYEIMLTDYIKDKVYQVAFCGTSGSGYNIHLDNIAVVDIHDNDMDITAFDVCERLAVGTSRQIDVTVRNHGAIEAQGYKVVLYRNGEAWKEANGTKTLKFGEEETLSFEISATITDAGSTDTYYAQVVYAADQDNTNDRSEEKNVTIPTPDYPAITNLSARQVSTGIELTWDEPIASSEDNVITESFENFDAFTITDFGQWTLFDIDALETYGISNTQTESGIYEYPNACSQMAFQVMNPALAGLTSKTWTPFAGNQMAVAFASVGGQNNDWLISPPVVGGTTVTFYAKSASVYYGEESFYFCYSETDSATKSFKPIENLQKAPYDTWGKFTFELPEEANYFAINYVSTELYALMIDDIEYEPLTPQLLELQGFKVYRDNELLTDNIVEDITYLDNKGIVEGNSYTYRVSTIYDKGESALSEPVTVHYLAGLDNVEYLPLIYVENQTLYIKDANGRHVSVNGMNGINYMNGIAEENLIAMKLYKGIYAVTIDGKTTKVIVK